MTSRATALREAMAFVRRELYDGLDLDFREALRRSLRSMAHLNASPDFAEGVASFIEKRPPHFAAAGRPASMPTRCSA